MATFNVQKARQKGLTDDRIIRAAQLHGATLSEPVSSQVAPGQVQAPGAMQEPQPAPAAPQGTPGREAGALDRFILAFGDARGREEYAKRKGIGTDATGTILQPKGFDLGDVTSKAGAILPGLGSSAGIAAGVPLGAAAGSLVPGPGTVLGGVAVGAGGGAAGAAAGQAGNSAIGELLGVRQNENQDETVKDLKSEAIWGAFTLPGGSAVKKGLLRGAKGPAQRMINALMPTPSEQLGGMFPAQEFLKRGFMGTLDTMRKQADDLIAKSDAVLKPAKEKMGNKVVATGDDIVESLSKMQEEARNAVDSSKVTTINKFFDDTVELIRSKTKGTFQITLKTADEIRTAMDKTLAEAHKKARQNIPIPDETDARKAIADMFRDKINKNLPREAAKANADKHIALLFKRAVDRREVKRSLLGTVIKTSAGTAGAGIGTGIAIASGNPYLAGVLGPAGALAGYSTAKALSSTPVRTVTAQAQRPIAAISKILAETPGVPAATANAILRLLH